jgi:hypothetical protein
MKSSFHCLIPFLALFFNCHFRRLGSIQFLSSQAYILAGCPLETPLTLLCNYFSLTTQKTQPLYCWEGVFKASLRSNGSYSIVAYVFLVAGMCLPSRCLTMNVYSDFTIPGFGGSCHNIFTEGFFGNIVYTLILARELDALFKENPLH